MSPQQRFKNSRADRLLRRWQAHAAEPRWNKLIVAAAGSISLIALIAWLDEVSGPHIHLFVFYLLPIVFIAWQAGWQAGIVGCVVCIIPNLVGATYRGDLGTADWVTAAARLLVSSAIVMGWCRVTEMGHLLSELSLVDPLTALQNRRACLFCGDAELQRMRRNGKPLSLMFIDLDNFKVLNDSQGHKAGDRLLREIACELSLLVRQSDTAVRLGGDEFAVILPDTDGRGARLLGDKVHTGLNRVLRQSGSPVSTSIGIATFQQPPYRFDEVLHQADLLMYEIKHSGKNGVLQRDVHAGLVER